MQIRSLAVTSVGPFTEMQLLPVNERLTAVVGQNDAGKSFLLNALDLAMGTQSTFDEVLINESTRDAAEQDNQQAFATIEVTLTLSESEAALLIKEAQVDDGASRKIASLTTLRVSAKLQNGQIKRSYLAGSDNMPSSQVTLKRPNNLPRVAVITTGEPQRVRNIQTQGPGESVGKIVKDAKLAQQATKAFSSDPARQDKLIKNFNAAWEKKQFGASGGIAPQYQLISNPNERHSPYLMTRDEYGILVFADQRGSGSLRIKHILDTLHSEIEAGATAFVIDEPERSLHPGLQRELLDKLLIASTIYSIQIIFATHSPSMLPVGHESDIHLIERKWSKETVSSFVARNPIGTCNSRLIGSLGLRLEDALFMTGVIVLVEGETDAAIIFDCLAHKAICPANELETLRELLDKTRILWGQGDTTSVYARILCGMCRLVILAVDGDNKGDKIIKNTEADKIQNIRTIQLNKNNTILDIFNREVILEETKNAAVAHLSEARSGTLDQDQLMRTETVDAAMSDAKKAASEFPDISSRPEKEINLILNKLNVDVTHKTIKIIAAKAALKHDLPFSATGKTFLQAIRRSILEAYGKTK